MKKTLKISAIVIGLILLIIIALPFAFKGKIQKAVQVEINKNLNAAVSFDGVGANLFRHFPNLTLNIENLHVVGSGDFEKDTLAAIPTFSITLDLASVFSGNAYKVKQIAVSSPQLLFKVLKNGKANWDIMKVSDTMASASEPSSFKVYLDKISITDASILYDDSETPMLLSLVGLNAQLSGDMTADITSLNLKTVVDKLTADYDGIRYISNSNAEISTLLNADLNNMVFTFKEGNLSLNDLKLTADGSFAMPEEGYKMDIRFAAKENTFKSFLSLIPAIYSKDFESVKTTGTMALDGFVKGLYNDISMPAFA
ncbi:MAG: AsmA family protein, partial [Bacteroidales bacterium]